MKLFLIDFGERCNGPKYAIISAYTKNQLFWMIDQQCCPSEVRIAQIGTEGNIHVELADPREGDSYQEFSEDLDLDLHRDEEKDIPDFIDRSENWVSFENLKESIF
tara:strand:+ start:162 stop:479 length:318 start_codon:yes stop_codon:yes gene_type:complete